MLCSGVFLVLFQIRYFWLLFYFFNFKTPMSSATIHLPWKHTPGQIAMSNGRRIRKAAGVPREGVWRDPGVAGMGADKMGGVRDGGDKAGGDKAGGSRAGGCPACILGDSQIFADGSGGYYILERFYCSAFQNTG